MTLLVVREIDRFVVISRLVTFQFFGNRFQCLPVHRVANHCASCPQTRRFRRAQVWPGLPPSRRRLAVAAPAPAFITAILDAAPVQDGRVCGTDDDDNGWNGERAGKGRQEGQVRKLPAGLAERGGASGAARTDMNGGPIQIRQLW